MFEKFFLGPPAITKINELVTSETIKSTARFLENGQVREMLNFSNIDEVEKDRIFNEVILTGIAMAVLMAELLSRFAENEKQDFLKKIKNDLPNAYVRILQTHKVENKYLELWKKVIKLRCDEFYENWIEHRSVLPQADKGNPWVSISATTGFFHIRTKNISKEDSFFLTFSNFISELSLKTEKILAKNIKRI